MADTPPPPHPAPPETWEPLGPHERRVLGVLVEKQKTSKSADAYPLTLNALTTGCNQKSNREPVMELAEDEVEETLGRLQARGLTSKVTGGRVDRYRHNLYEAWKLAGQGRQMAVMAELLLRGPQSEGDLRGRAARMDEIKDLDELKGILRGLADRGLVVYLTPADRRGAVVTHGFHAPAELEAARTRFAGGTGEWETPAPRGPVPVADNRVESRLAAAEAEIATLKEAVAVLQQVVADLQAGRMTDV